MAEDESTGSADDDSVEASGRGSDGTLRIHAPDESLEDEPIAVRITGATPGQPVRLVASMRDRDGNEWSSRATFVADGDGVVDLTERAPAWGSYDGVDPMGWLQSMAADVDAQYRQEPDAEQTTVRFTASSGDREAERVIVRRRRAPGVTRRSIDREDLAGTLYEPPGDGPQPGVLLLHGSGAHRLERMAALLASHGYVALALQYFGEPDGVPDDFVRIPLSYFDAAASWLREQPGVRDGPLGVLGMSRGGELAILLGARADWVGTVVSYNGSGLAPTAPGTDGEPPWMDGGEPVPCVSISELLDPVELPGPTTEGYRPAVPVIERGLDALDGDRLRELAFAVEETDGPVVLVSGGEDQVWDARALSRVAADRLERAGFEHDHVHLTDDGAGHLVRPPYLPTAGRRVRDGKLFGGTAEGHARADADAWPIALECLEEGLGGDDTTNDTTRDT